MKPNPWVTGQITLSANGVPVKLSVTVPTARVKPQAMLPVFQKMANAFTDLGIAGVEKVHQKISCKAGCGACCRQPVPLAEVEVYHLAQLVQNLPEPRRSEVRQRFEAAASHFEEKGWFEKLENCREEEELQGTIREYFFEHIACPLLENGSCSIYEARPVICREFLVTSPAENCSTPRPENINQVPLPLKASEGLRQLGRGESLPEMNFIPLILALRLAEKYPEHFSKKTGEQWLGDFFNS